MEFDGSGVGIVSEIKEFEVLSQNNEPIISFSPNRCRFNKISSQSGSLDISDFVLGPSESSTSTLDEMTNSSETPQALSQPKNSTTSAESRESPTKNTTIPSSNSNNCSQQIQSELQRRLEKRIAQASSVSVSSTNNCKPNLQTSANSNNSNSATVPFHQEYDNQSLGRIASVMLNDTGESTCENPIVRTTNLKGSMTAMTASSGFDMRKVPTLLPPQRLAIPNKSSNATTCSLTSGGTNPTKPHSQEKKPLVQWDSEESEEELSFFPAPKLRSTLTDNLSIDNMSLSGEEDDLHLSPPRSMSNRCPCDPRLLMDSSSKSRKAKNCNIV